jgi:16S rRNA (cytosine967-C5)-methyltransferase
MLNINEREIALYALMDILDSGGYNNIVLSKTLSRYKGVDYKSRNMVTEMVNGTLRQLLYIDYILSLYSKTPLNKVKPYLLSLLRVSVYQLLFMDKIPHSAVCDEAVKLAKKRGYAGLSGFVNGVLRNVSRDASNFPMPDVEKEPARYISIKYSCPEWIVNYWLTFMDIGKVSAVCQAQNTPPKVSINVNTLKNTPAELTGLLESEGVQVEKGMLSSNALRLMSGSSKALLGDIFAQGLFHVMDESDMMVVELAELKPGMRILDLCAAPGGKSFYSAYITGDSGEIDAMDIHPHKIDLINEGINRLGLESVKAKINDACIYNKNLCGYDTVFLDAPCSGLGVLSKRPDSKYKKTFQDIESLSEIQRTMLRNSALYPKIGGKLIYSTCTLSVIENEKNVEWFLKEFPYEQTAGFRIYPDEYGTDGFFAVCLVRKE